jgi:Holliday junction resolvase RusA-like endonuclease
MISILLENVVIPSATHQSKKLGTAGGRARMFDSKELKDARAWWTAMLAPHRPQVPLSGPLWLLLTITYPHRAATPKRDLGREIPKTTKPDCDNLSKTVTDIMATLGFFGDDAQIAELWVKKSWGPTGSVSIVLKNI